MSDGGGIDEGALRVQATVVVQAVRTFAGWAGRNLDSQWWVRLPAGIAEVASLLANPGQSPNWFDVVEPIVRRASSLADGRSTPPTAPTPGARLESVLATVGLRRGEARPVFPLAPLGEFARDELFPEAPARPGDSGALFDDFMAEWRDVAGGSDISAVATGMTLLAKYAWCVPAPGSRDVSLADHARVTAAIAACLWEVRAEHDQRLALIGGDVSGVQAFLYRITSAGALQGLRGRSFYLQLVEEAVGQYLLRRWHLPVACRVMEAGGHIYILAPARVLADVPRARGHLAQAFFDHHGGDLFVGLAGVEIGASELGDPRVLEERFARLGEALSRAKRRRGEGLEPEQLAKGLFTPRKVGGLDHQFCRICDRPISGAQAVAPAGGDRNARTCALCLGLQELGGRLRRGSVMVTWPTAPSITVPTQSGDEDDDASSGWGTSQWNGVLGALGLGVRVLDARNGLIGRHLRGVPTDVEASVLRLQDTDLPKAAEAARDLGLVAAVPGFRLLAQSTPNAPDGRAIADFGDLADAATGSRYVGFLRGDVDNLGSIVLGGLRDRGADHANRGTLARRVALSMSLRLFFEGHLSWLCQNSGAALGKAAHVKPDSLYLIYAGGDDLFIAGAWDATARVALAIDEALGKYAGGNPAVHLSAGLAMGHAKYPLSAGAHDADDAQKKAKDHRRLVAPGALPHDKDAIHLFGRTIGWEHLKPAIDLADTFIVAVRGSRDTAPRGFLRLALQIVNLEQKERERQCKLDDADRRASERDGKAARTPRLREGQAALGRWFALAAYHLSRAKRPGNKGAPPRVDPALVQAVEALLVNSTGIDTLAVAAQWADLAVR